MIKKIPLLKLICPLLVITSSCSSTTKKSESANKERPKLPLIVDHFPVDYGPILQTIKELAKIGKKDRWLNEKYVTHQRIKTAADLEKALAYYGDEETPLKNRNLLETLLFYLKKADSSYHFGFEGDYHAIVFFDQKGNQIYVFPEQH